MTLENKSAFRFLGYFLLHTFLVIGVILLFSFIAEKKIAALYAGTLFLIGPLYVLFREWKLKQLGRNFSTWLVLLFLVLFAIPIFSLRLTHWQEPFDSLSLFGIPAVLLHKFSSYFFIVLMLGFLADFYRLRSQKGQVK